MGIRYILNGKLYIHLPYIPSISGDRYFASKMNAQKAAEIVAGKLRHKNFPPTVSKEELSFIGVIN